jgi:hypothetical protein
MFFNNKVISLISGKGCKTTLCHNAAKATANILTENTEAETSQKPKTLIVDADSTLFYGLPSTNYRKIFAQGNFTRDMIITKETNIDVFTTTSSFHNFLKIEDRFFYFMEEVIKDYSNIFINLPGGDECQKLFIKYIQLIENINSIQPRFNPIFCSTQDPNAIEFSISIMNNIYQSNKIETKFEEYYFVFSKIGPALARKSKKEMNSILFKPFYSKIMKNFREDANITVSFDESMLKFFDKKKYHNKMANLRFKALPHIVYSRDIDLLHIKKIPFVNVIYDNKGIPISINRNCDPTITLNQDETKNTDVLRITDPDNTLLAKKAIEEFANIISNN